MILKQYCIEGKLLIDNRTVIHDKTQYQKVQPVYQTSTIIGGSLLSLLATIGRVNGDFVTKMTAALREPVIRW